MLIQFDFANFRSFKTMQTLSLQAANIVSKYPELDQNNVIVVSPKLKLLTSKAIYGANASGKSNVVKAFATFLLALRHSVNIKNILAELVAKYELSVESEEEPTFFQLIFTAKNADGKEIMYRYGFEVKGEEIASEWLFGTPKRVEVPFFVREGRSVTVNERAFKGAKDFLPMINNKDNEVFRGNSLFLSAFAAVGMTEAKHLVEALTKMSVLSGLNEVQLRQFVGEKLLENDLGRKTAILHFLKDADLCVEDIFVEEENQEELFEKLPHQLKALAMQGKIQPQVSFFSTRNKYDRRNEKVGEVTRKLDDWESEGTKKMLDLSLFLFRALEEGRVLIVDEFDARLHPLLTKKIVHLFNSNITNPNHAQLVFVTHDTSLMKPSLLRRDQICLVEKDKFGSSTIRTLIEFKGTRNDKLYETQYLQGVYGAVPFLNDFESEFIKSQPHA